MSELQTDFFREMFKWKYSLIRAENEAQVAQHLSSLCEDLSSIPRDEKGKKNSLIRTLLTQKQNILLHIINVF
jgi:hypothetical protein